MFHKKKNKIVTVKALVLEKPWLENRGNEKQQSNDRLQKSYYFPSQNFMCGLLMKVEVGDKAPDFTLPSQTGENVTLSKYFGKKNIVLYFYPKDESPGCTKEACNFRDNYEGFKLLGAEVIGVNSGSVESHRSFAEHHNLPFVLLSDAGDKVRKLYGVPSTLGLMAGRVTYVIDKNGVVRHIFSSQFQPGKAHNRSNENSKGT